VADFMGVRFGDVAFEETLGSAALIESLVEIGGQERVPDDEFVVVPPGGEITQDLFLRAGEVAPAARAEKAD
jgi:hypothetical protein